MRALRRVLGAALIVLGACSGIPEADPVPAVPELIHVRRGGVQFYLHPTDLDFVDVLYPKVRAYRAQIAPILGRCRAFISDHLPDPESHNRFALDTPLGAQLFTALSKHLKFTAEEEAESRELWTRFTSVDGLYAAFMSRMLNVSALDQVRIATFDEVRGGKIPFWSYKPDEDQMNVSIHVSINSEGQYFSDLAGRRVPDERVYFAGVVCRDPSPAGRTWEQRLESLANSLKELEAGLNSMSGKGGEFMLFDRGGYLAAFIALHEVSEMWLIQHLEIRDPLARWFHDGAADLIAENILREQISEEAALSTPYSARQAAKYASLRPTVNLLAWARKDVQDHLPLNDQPAYYYFATEEVRGLQDRHGKDALRRLILRLKEAKPVTTEKILEVVRDLWNDDLPARLDAYHSKASPTAVVAALDAVGKKRWAAALPILRQIAGQAPRDPQSRYHLVGALLSQDPVKNLPEILFHARIYVGLMESVGKEPEMFPVPEMNADVLYAFGQMALASGNREGAKKTFEKILELAPGHRPSLDALKQLQNSK